MEKKLWYLYLLECEDGSLYTGIAVDVAKRYAAHLGGRGARYTRARKPKRLLGVRAFPDRSSASKAEYAVKQLNVAGKRRFLAELDAPATPAEAAPEAKTRRKPAPKRTARRRSPARA